MARVLYGDIVTELKGKLNGHVFQPIGSSFAVRSYKIQQKNKSASGQKKRTIWAETAALWNTLTPTQQQSYHDHAYTYPTYDKFGVKVTLNRYQMFMLINYILVQFNFPIITTLADWQDQGHQYYVPSQINANSQLAYFYRNFTPPTNVIQIWKVYGPLPSTSNSPWGKFRIFVSMRYNTGLNPNLWSYLTPLFRYTPTNNDWLYFESYNVNTDTGSYGLPVDYDVQMNQ
jgi:hypothetical protein